MSSTIVIQDTLPYTQSIATNLQTVFDTNWTVDDASDVRVYDRDPADDADDQSQLVSSADYNVTFVGVEQFVRVTFLVGRTLNNIITLTRATPFDRENLYTNTNFTPTMLNGDFGRLTLMVQDLQLLSQNLTPHYNYDATIVQIEDTILPILAANQIWSKNSTNDAIIAVTVGAAGTGNVASGLINQIAWYALTGSTVSGLPTANNGVLVTGPTGIPSISSTLPAGITLPGYLPLSGGVMTGGITGITNLEVDNIQIDGDSIIHLGDINNKIVFGTDTQDFQTGGSSRLDLSDTGMRLGGANSRVTTILDEDNMVSDSATALATQQSIKAYVDGRITTGTFNPGVAFGGGTTGITYTGQGGEYLQIGNIVFITGFILLSNKGSSTGDVSLTGFPVASVASPSSRIFSNGESMTINNNNLFLIFNNGNTTCNLLYQQTGGVNGSYTDTEFTNTTQIAFSGFYFTS